MPSEPSSRPPKPAGAPPPEPEHLPCPRCDSTNTKFCYYNNYNFSQPRHFCKSCRRYWTHGGTLRDIPVGGGSRKNAKRSRLTTPQFRPNTAAPILFPFAGDLTAGGFQFSGEGKHGCDSFTTLLSGNQFGFDDVGFGIGRGVWPFSGVGDVAGGGYVGSTGVDTWRVDGGESGGECFTWPDLAISTPGMI